MALPPVQQPEVQRNVQAQSDAIDGLPEGMQTAPPTQEIYRLDPATKIPVSKYEGSVWQSRKNAGLKAISDLIEGWQEAEDYYNNAQQNHRMDTAGNKAGNRYYAKNRRDAYSMTENIVYATVNAVIPSTYAKNPTVEVTMTDETQEEFGTMLKHLLNRIASMKASPGINLKPKIRKSIVRCEITNEAWILVGWTKREDSADQALEDIKRIGAELADPKTEQKDIIRLEGELMALEESIDLLDPPGPFVKTLRGKDVLVDPDACEDDFSDANWEMFSVMVATNYLNARYRVKLPNGEFGSVYKPTHIVDATAASSQEQVQKEVDNFKMFNPERDNYKEYGYESRRAYDRGKRTKVWYVLDRVKRRFYMYADNDWTWPVWVFDDPYHLPRFYPLHRLQYHTDPKNTRARGEVSHYLDQQDEINTVVDELNRARTALRDNAFFDSNVMTNKDAEDIVLNANKKLKGIKVPEGKTLDKLIMAPPMPTLAFAHLWDTSNAKSAINTISGVGDAMRGEQFKTNTTNKAIEEYSSIGNVRLDEKRDAIEDFVGDIMYDIMFLLLQFMNRDTMASLVGSKYAQVVASIPQNMAPEDIRKNILCRIEGGSTQKPTSSAKKGEALQIGQILGQFASASPVVVLILLKVFQRAFDGVDMTAADWQELRDGIMMQMQRGNSSGQGDNTGGGNANAEAAIKELVTKGMPEAEARKRVQEATQGNGAQATQTPVQH